ncbi:MAG: hypothetical protein QUU85_11320, partial [Candidatus Eisenbacteria bacterium]|nr:hypothetical protein [Candidatus Eisenbacteria bacterium]
MRESLGHEAGVWFLENLAHLVPGYQGYRERDLRRAEDARLRAQVLERMADIRAAIEAWSETLPDGIDQDCAQAIERRAARPDSLADAIRYAPYAVSYTHLRAHETAL